jgi:hypothetical protein
MTFSSKSSSSTAPADPHRDGFEQFHPRRHIYSSPPQLTLVDVLAMQAIQTQAQAPPSGGGLTPMPLWIARDTVPSSSTQREVLARGLEAMMAVLDDEDTIPSDRNINTGGSRRSADRPKPNSHQNSPHEPSAQ